MDVRNEILSAHHSLIAGTTGSGKSTVLNAVICEGLERGYAFWFIDLKRVELNQYKKTKNCLAFAKEPEQAVSLLDDIIDDMDDEYDRMEARGLKESERPHRYLVIDELADLLNTDGVLDRIVKIGRLGRAAHIHMIGATQDPSRKTLSAQLMQNITCAVALRCKNSTESRQIIGEAGAESLPEHGKCYVSTFKGIKKADSPFISNEDIDRIISAHSNDVRCSELPSVEPSIENASTLARADKWIEESFFSAPVSKEGAKRIYNVITLIIALSFLTVILTTPGVLESIVSTLIAGIVVVRLFLGGRKRR